jgi:hypothetical protein
MSLPGRKWRPLSDTAVAAQILYEAPNAWKAWRRSVDFYPEGDLIWLEADVTIRNLTAGGRNHWMIFGVSSMVEKIHHPWSKLTHSRTW